MVDDFKKKNEFRLKQGNCPYKPTVFVIACKTLDQDKVRGKKQSGRKRWSQITQINKEFLMKLESVFFKYPTCYTHDT